jgi:hypothetical protein
VAIQYIAKVLAHSESRLASRLVLLAIANYCDENGTAYPSVNTIARDAKITSRQVRRCLADLVILGELSVDEAASLYGTNLYHINEMGGDKLSGVTNHTQNMSNLSAYPLIKPLGSKEPRPIQAAPQSVTTEYIATLHALYDDSHSREWVDDKVEAALNHKAYKAAIDKQLYLGRWLARDAKTLGSKGGSNGNGNRIIKTLDATEERWSRNATGG